VECNINDLDYKLECTQVATSYQSDGKKNVKIKKCALHSQAKATIDIAMTILMKVEIFKN
jgi:hypothetical protein